MENVEIRPSEAGINGFLTEIILYDINDVEISCTRAKTLELLINFQHQWYLTKEDNKFIKKCFSYFGRDENILSVMHAILPQDHNLYASETIIGGMYIEESKQEEFFELIDNIADILLKKENGAFTIKDELVKNRYDLELIKLKLDSIINIRQQLAKERNMDINDETIESEVIQVLKNDYNYCTMQPLTCKRACKMSLTKILEASPSTGEYEIFAFLNPSKYDENRYDSHVKNVQVHLNDAIVQILNEKHSKWIASMPDGVKYWLKNYFYNHVNLHKEEYKRDGVKKSENGTFVLYNKEKKEMRIVTFTLVHKQNYNFRNTGFK